MRELIDRLTGRLPLQFRVLYRQFLLRVVDLEALSIEADVPRFLGQFAGVLIMFSLAQALVALWFPPPPTFAWHVEQAQVSNVMLLIGLCSVITWDTTFPDRRDIMILAALPVRPRTILLAKLAASGALFGIAIVSLNFASSIAWSLVFGGGAGFARFFVAHWLTVTAAGAFLYASVLTIQGFAALLLTRRMFLRASAILQLIAFAVFLGVYFLQPSLDTKAELLNPAHHWLLASSPTFWFFGFFNQLNGSLPPELTWLAHRAWIAIGAAVLGAAASLLLCYLRTMKKSLEEPDLVPGRGGLHWVPRLGNSLQTAIALFSIRSIARSRQHRVVLAFYWAVVFAIALSGLQREISTPPGPISVDFLISTYMMMCFAVLGLPGVFSLPISLNANWVLRTTQLRPTAKYIAATRRTLQLFAVGPIVSIAALLSLSFRPWTAVAAHLGVLAMLGFILVEIGLIKSHKVPFTCSYLPGKTNIQVIFWGFMFIVVLLAITVAPLEEAALHDPLQGLAMLGTLSAVVAGLWVVNHHRAKSAVLSFEDVPPEVIMRLGLVYVEGSQAAPEQPAAS